jgi:hypothetical protein
VIFRAIAVQIIGKALSPCNEVTWRNTIGQRRFAILR